MEFGPRGPHHQISELYSHKSPQNDFGNNSKTTEVEEKTVDDIFSTCNSASLRV